MKYDFNQMEESMDMLAKNMDSITSFSEQISSTLQSSRHQITRLSSVHSLLKKLQFLFKLPNKLKDRIKDENYSQVHLL
jgi:predicted AAA+ superfamily ATPase